MYSNNNIDKISVHRNPSFYYIILICYYYNFIFMENLRYIQHLIFRHMSIIYIYINLACNKAKCNSEGVYLKCQSHFGCTLLMADRYITYHHSRSLSLFTEYIIFILSFKKARFIFIHTWIVFFFQFFT